MDLKKGFYRIIAKVLVWVMIVQGIPFWQLSQVYTFEFNPDRLVRAVNFLTSALLSPSNAHAGVPPDLNDYTTNKIPNNFIDISSTGAELALSDEGGISGVPIGFNFRFYNTIFTEITITSNGYLSFSSIISPDNTLIPSTDVPNALIAPFWDDLNPELNPSSGIFFETKGTAPNRRFIVEYKDVPLKSDPDSRLTFQVVLFEENNEIQYHYLSMIDGSGLTISPLVTGNSATVGIENIAGDKGNEAVFNQADSLSSGSAFSFTLAGTAFETGRFLGDLNNDGQVNIQDQYVLTKTMIETRQTQESLDLVLADISPVPAVDGGPFGDQTIDADDHSRIFEAVMAREILNPTLSISSYYIASASETLTLFGSGFDLSAGNNSIIFKGTDGTETIVSGESVNAEASELTVTIPSGLLFPLSVRADRGSMMSNSLLFLLQGVPLITRITPDNGEEGDTITIRGYEFGALPGDNIVLFNGVSAVVQSVTDTSLIDTLIVTIPTGASTGSLTVTVASQPSNEVAFIYDGAPIVAISSPAEDDEIGGQMDVIGTASDLGLVSYSLELGVVNPDYSVDYSTIASGTESIIDGILGTIDATLMINGFYR
ncbi:MAG: IPT/TIG domain-containing protein, partial [Desulfobacula sp.]|uniref:IPT/TIG domain-containing protein n=1 Tax=Desulfobacula sp. TaxID=2593537 RepID=UPI0025BE0FEF